MLCKGKEFFGIIEFVDCRAAQSPATNDKENVVSARYGEAKFLRFRATFDLINVETSFIVTKLANAVLLFIDFPSFDFPNDPSRTRCHAVALQGS